jgi:asparagine synthase (glutamine-hydrolysing)
MCGIAGSINLGNNENIVFSSLYHRGPDEQNSVVHKNTIFYHTRLSIQDISHGQQPFQKRDYTMVFNGEIYNHLKLREDYLQEFNFQTTSDTETLLCMYEKFKERMFSYLDGMYAFAILDIKREEIFLARDRSGKKPLYIYNDTKSLFFASELNTIKNVKLDLKIHEVNINGYLRTGFFFKESTPYHNVKALDAGTYCCININTLESKEKKYFDILTSYHDKKNISFSEALSNVDSLLHKSVKDRLLSSDLEVGAFLSGGIDSSLIVAIASEYKDKLKTFTVKFDGTYDESPLAKLTAQKYNTSHHEISISMNLKDDIEKILLNYGAPFMDSSAIPSYYVSQEAKKHVTVILNGDGADELFGGYRRYVPSANGLIKYARYFSFLSKVIPKPQNKKSLYTHIFRLLKMSNKNGLDFYLSSTSDIFEDEYTFENNDFMNSINALIDNTKLDDLSKMLYLDFNMILFSNLLVKIDIATMASSLEGRSPFLSKYLLEYVPGLPNKYKVKGRNTKYILRELSKKYLSPELINQPKRGFEVPLKKWVNIDLKENIYDALSSNSYSRNFIDQKFINQLLSNKGNMSEEKRVKMLWTLYCLDVWKKNL